MLNFIIFSKIYLSVNCPVGEPPVGELVVGELCVGELSVGEPTRTPKNAYWFLYSKLFWKRPQNLVIQNDA